MPPSHGGSRRFKSCSAHHFRPSPAPRGDGGGAVAEPDRERLERWLAALEARHLADLRFAEVRRGLVALSSLYVERRARLGARPVFDGAGKRAAFALYYGPLHFLVVRGVVAALGARTPRRLLELGCGTGAAGAAWALGGGAPARLDGVDRHPWAVDEARWTLRQLGLPGTVRRGDLGRVRLPGRGGGVLLAWTANELDDADREALLPRLLAAAAAGAAVLVVEPIARRVAPWWPAWVKAFEGAGGRADEWRLPLDRPALVARLDRASGLDHATTKVRSLWHPGR